MKVLWVVNTILPPAASYWNIPVSNFQGWLVYTAELLSQNHDLVVCSPGNEKKSCIVDSVKYYTFINSINKNDYCLIENQFKEILGSEMPDVIHVWGTEYSYSSSVANAANNLNILKSVVVSIQGLVSICYKHYMGSLPGKVQLIPSIRDLIRRDTLKKQQKNMYLRGEYEKDLLRKCKHVIGRTHFDRACVELINPSIQYHFNNETLRKSFYNHQWGEIEYEKHRIFVSQGHTPYKGFHFLIEALGELKEEYPEIQVYVAGNANPVSCSIKATAYQKYMRKLSEQLKVIERIHYVGCINEHEMIEQYLKANVFISPSVIENSPNSVGEAMLLGMPIVSSDVGGVSTILKRDEEGWLYPCDEPYMLAACVKEVFDKEKYAVVRGKKAREHALVTHDPEVNYFELCNIYKNIVECNH